MPGTVLVAGALASKPGNGGEAWVRLSWIRALTELGFAVRFVEQCDGATPAQRTWFDEVVRWAALEDRSLLLADEDPRSVEVALAWAGDAALLINISGNLRRRDVLDRAAVRVYMDLDPAYTQMWHEQGVLGDTLDRHHHHATVGLCVGRASCTIPTAGREWLPVVPPVCLDDWAGVPAVPGRFTTVGAFRGGYGRLEHDGVVYGQKAHELRRFIDLPTVVDWDVEFALAIDPADHADRDALVAHGWRLRDPAAAARTPVAFRQFVHDSSAELSVAQGAYVATASGWISDRSVRYLAAGRPVLVQDTGLGRAVPADGGLLTFRDLDDATRQARRIVDEYDAQCRAASAWARTFAAPLPALTPLLERAGVAP